MKFRCKIGLHKWHDGNLTRGLNVGTHYHPVYILQSYRLCRLCNHEEVL